ncbi:bifunctional 4-hydroxy-2-oxoglutarate aldolase/2-dehydro-3-deoxy-phosphogluconate aldolase [Nesterenkonia populi]|uniref:bifunctional 4-hydroxy-2-oxoglutarate aldolase/2-dehydro-3-deoxy-phosphogluconate aldolase n=1 Tax=Nesterenkonia populi TaxID=1591087 RepID=UPI0011BDF32C|nr:bifunctional 4-hydroxy-2-oxoglutarate aldolase/2-dehydro-3-deoxy-phosphogluconate aldolase [Nesterenkonia populi]
MSASTSTVLDRLSAVGVIPVIALDDAAQAAPLAEALAEGGLPAAEITFRTDAAAEAIAAAVQARPDVLVGAGTVVAAEQVDAAADAGAQYIVSPGTSARVIERAQHRGLPVLPGAVTATEIQAALECGLDTVKFFPAGTSGGPAAIKALAAPFGGLSFVPTGGVSLNNLADYLSLPAVRAVGGSWITPQGALNAGDYAQIRHLAAEAAAAVAEIRG